MKPRGRLAGVSERVTKTAACIYTTTPDHGFILDHCPGEPGIFVISACSGHGFKHSAGIGEAVADVLARRPSAPDLTPFGLRRFSRGRASQEGSSI